MKDDLTSRSIYRISKNPDALFWVLHLSGWSILSLLTYVSLSVPYNQFELNYLAHNVLQSIVGVFVSLPMRYLCRTVWDEPPIRRLVSIITMIMVLAFVWSVIRLLLFLALTEETGLWADFGGWLFPSIFVFMSWVALYHGIKYYQLLQLEHENLLKAESLQRSETLKLAWAESAARESQLKLLRYQLNPHFLFNTLNSISALAATHRTDDAQEMLLKLSEFLRLTLESDYSAEIPLHKELEAIGLYLSIEQVRFADRLKVSRNIESGAEHVLVPSLLLQPLVENALKFAVAKSESGGVIAIGAAKQGDNMVLSVEDSGADDFSPSTLDTMWHHSGIGLDNTRERLATFFGDSSKLTAMHSALGGARIEIQLPWRKAEVAHGSP